MDVTPIVKEGLSGGLAAGISGGLVALVSGIITGLTVGKKRAARIHARVEALEVQIAKDQKFRRIVVESQMSQIELQQIIIDRLLAKCEDCPSAAPKSQDERVQGIIDAARNGLRTYLGGIA
jgi:hypothetical protein